MGPWEFCRSLWGLMIKTDLFYFSPNLESEASTLINRSTGSYHYIIFAYLYWFLFQLVTNYSSWNSLPLIILDWLLYTLWNLTMPSIFTYIHSTVPHSLNTQRAKWLMDTKHLILQEPFCCNGKNYCQPNIFKKHVNGVERKFFILYPKIYHVPDCSTEEVLDSEGIMLQRNIWLGLRTHWR